MKQLSANTSKIEGVGAIILILTIGIAICFVAWHQGQILRRKALTLGNSADEITASTQVKLRSLKEMEDTKNEVASLWASMQRWFPGPLQAADFGSIRSLGIPVTPPAIFPSEKSSIQAIAFRARGNSAEFQRFTAALNTIEEKYGFLQVYRLQMTLPDDVPPMSAFPTYLNITTEFYHPQTKAASDSK